MDFMENEHLPEPPSMLPSASTASATTVSASTASTSTASSGIEAANMNSIDNATTPQHNGASEENNGEVLQTQVQSVHDHQHEGVSGRGMLDRWVPSEADEAIIAIITGHFPEGFTFVELKPPSWLTLPEEVLSGKAPLRLDHVANYMEGGRDGPSGRAFIEMSHEDKASAAFQMFLPGPRRIRATWSIFYQRWVYLSLRRPNLVPFVVEGFNGAMEKLCTEVFTPAPHLGISTPYQFFNYELDTLFLDFGHCTRTETEKKEFNTAIRTAANAVYDHNGLAGVYPIMRAVHISYCPAMFKPGDIKVRNRLFEMFFGAERITMEAHNHSEVDAPSPARTSATEE